MQGHELLVALVTMGTAAAIGALLAIPLGRWQQRRERAVLPAGGAPRRATWASGLAKTRGNLARRLLDAWTGAADRDAWLARVEEILLSSDVGVKATQALLERWRREVRDVQSAAELRMVVTRSVREALRAPAEPAVDAKPEVIL